MSDNERSPDAIATKLIATGHKFAHHMKTKHRRSNRSLAAHKAWKTRRSPTRRARRTTRASQAALKEWAGANGWHLTFLDGPNGNPRTGIVDAVLVRVAKGDADKLEVRLLQLKGGTAGLTATERRRLAAACNRMSVLPAYGYFDGSDIDVDLPSIDPSSK